MADTLYRSNRDFALFDAHHWEDWVELRCLASRDGETDVATIADRYQEERDAGKGGTSFEDSAQQAVIADPNTSIGDGGKGGLLADATWASDIDKKTLLVKSWFISLTGRATLLGDYYPFEINPQNSKLTLRSNLSPGQKLYVALLMMSNLHYFRTEQADLTSSFEDFGVVVFKWLLPAHATVHRFGKGKHNNGRYKGHIWDKLKLLCEDLSCDIKCKKEDFSPQDSGEAGLDLVGWVPWQDSAAGRLLLFGQCACTPKWVNEQLEASAAMWNSKLEFITQPLTVVLIPYFLRIAGGAWHRKTDFAGHLIIDRLRFLRILGPEAANLQQLTAFEHVNACLAAKEDF